MLFWIVLFLVRRLIVVGVWFVFPDSSYVQLGTFLVTSLLAVAYIGFAKPYYWLFFNRVQLCNEFMNVLVADIYLALTADVFDTRTLLIAGYVLNFFVGLQLLYNLCILIWATFGLIKTWCKRIYSEWKRSVLEKKTKLQGQQQPVSLEPSRANIS